MVYVFMADGCEEIEALAPVDMLRRGGVEVTTVGVTGKTVTGSHNISVNTDISLEEVNLRLSYPLSNPYDLRLTVRHK